EVCAMKVELITPERYTDNFVVDCARVSYSKRSSEFTPAQNAKLIKYLANPPDGVPHWAPFAGVRVGFTLNLSDDDFLYFLEYSNLAGFSYTRVYHEDDKFRPRTELNGSLWAWK